MSIQLSVYRKIQRLAILTSPLVAAFSFLHIIFVTLGFSHSCFLQGGIQFADSNFEDGAYHFDHTLFHIGGVCFSGFGVALGVVVVRSRNLAINGQFSEVYRLYPLNQKCD